MVEVPISASPLRPQNSGSWLETTLMAHTLTASIVHQYQGYRSFNGFTIHRMN